MTITYTAEVATASFSCFLKLLTRWRGSIYKLLWKEFAVFAAIYFLLSFLYRFVFNDYQRRIFELISLYCESNNALIPVAFILGFYVTLIMTRYWNALGHIPWPDHMAMYVTANVQGLDDRGRMMRRTMLRYLCLSYTMTMAAISPAVKKRFPTFEHMVEAGLLTRNEMKSLEKIDTPHNKFFIPLAWTTRLVNMARKERRIEDEFALKTLVDEINQFRMHLATLFVYDWITVPLVYTQVVTVAVYMFFLACLMGRQFLTNNPDVPDMYFPLFTFLEYFFYMGWLKVAECLVNPFGEDEEDFDVNFLIDRNLQVSYIIVDEVYNEPPDLVRDQYWNETQFKMPYTAAAEPFRKQPYLGSTADIRSMKELDLGTGREEMDTIREAESMDEMDSEFGVGSARQSHSFFQSPIAATGQAIRRLLSRQESRSYSRSGAAIPMTRMKESRSPSVAHSPAPGFGTLVNEEELQFHMEDDNREIDAGDNLLNEKAERRMSGEPIPMKTTSPARGKDSGYVPKISAQTEHWPEPSTSPTHSTKPSPREELKYEEKAVEAAPPSSEAAGVPTKSGAVAIQRTHEAAYIPPRSGATVFPSTFGATATQPRSESSAVPSTSATPTVPPAAFDSDKEMIDFTESSTKPESPKSPEPLTPTSPDPSDPVWVLASSRFNLTRQSGSDEAGKGEGKP